MIIECTSNNPKLLSKDIKKYALPFSDDRDSVLDVTIGKKYAVYGLMTKTIDWYLVHTDTINTSSFWWMPATLYTIYEGDKPKNWVQIENIYSFPVMRDREVCDGVIDGDRKAVTVLEKSAAKDSTFPGPEKIQELNRGLTKKLYEEMLKNQNKIAKERGWESID